MLRAKPSEQQISFFIRKVNPYFELLSFSSEKGNHEYKKVNKSTHFFSLFIQKNRKDSVVCHLIRHIFGVYVDAK
ncbi:hypothetical protein ATC1_11168 [Flexilinea flocculi]|jgi:hypothetical protein|uniref:Uncharacterized protein n=1 Tax=Flexilinea flocculi TaxID=1678840 RepID=A0A0K8P9E9_9CHLR|nr:hypothetical protein ATC1_11168 [Flexilinea flocculi]